MQKFVVVNQSTKVSDDDVKKMTLAVLHQLASHAAHAWDRAAPLVTFHGKDTPIPPKSQQLIIFDHADQAGVLGYHDETPDGHPYARIFADPVLENGGCVLRDPANPQSTSVASVLSHEALEQFVDPFCNSWVDCAIKQGGKTFSQVALEVGDPVEGDSYDITIADGTIVSVSDFILPAWFDKDHQTGPTNYLGTLDKPFTMRPGGYLIVRGSGGEGQIFGEQRAAWRDVTKSHAASRTSKRLDHVVVAEEVVEEEKSEKAAKKKASR